MAAANAAEQCDSSFQESPRLLKRTVDLSVQLSEAFGTYFFCFSGFDTKLGKVMVRRGRWQLAEAVGKYFFCLGALVSKYT